MRAPRDRSSRPNRTVRESGESAQVDWGQYGTVNVGNTRRQLTREGRLWNEFVARYHYLGYKPLVGAQMRYAVHDRHGWPLAMPGFPTAAWKLAPRDSFIGWPPELREKNLPLVVDNPRFLILPWVEVPNLGSHILAIVRRRLPIDWTERYGITPRAHRDLRRNPALHRRRVQGIRLDTGRDHPGQAEDATTRT